jgi:hypothetical protein
MILLGAFFIQAWCRPAMLPAPRAPAVTLAMVRTIAVSNVITVVAPALHGQLARITRIRGTLLVPSSRP